ncbi:hypothetical protein PV689_31990 [Streptomyces sp. ATCC51928]|uniref:Uncharacterized protein n=1 Tax=Streptomyces caviscabies TaxID=90079 RepID=A0ABW2MB82_9ACTN|nr:MULTISPECIES: hypothetical protein [unclassified Streptomyces]MDX3506541.1 hypothetical protein [Streptomyces sp. ATCC51928]MDX5519806.1 hypothetical protein [Streptomyces sp. DE06-01C]
MTTVMKLREYLMGTGLGWVCSVLCHQADQTSRRASAKGKSQAVQPA